MHVCVCRLFTKKENNNNNKMYIYNNNKMYIWIDRVRGDDVLAKEHCTSVIVGYGVKMKRRLCVSVQCAGCYFFFFV